MSTARTVAAVAFLASAAPAHATFTYERLIQAPTPAAGERFGAVLARVGTTNTVLVGTQPGPTTRAKVYRYNVLTGGAPIKTYLSPNVGGGDLFGAAIVAFGSSVFVGSPGWNGRRGAVYEFDLVGGTLVRSFLNDTLTPGAAEFGTSLAVVNGHLLVGAPLAPHSFGLSPVGKVFVFDLSGTTPTVPVRACEPDLPALNARYGGALAAVGANLAIGSPGYTTASTYGVVFFVDPLAQPVSGSCMTHWTRTVSTVGARFGEAVENVAGTIVGGAPGVAKVVAYDDAGGLRYSQDIGSLTTWGYGASLGAMGSNLLAGIPTAPTPGAILYSGVGGLVENHAPSGFQGTQYGYAIKTFNHRAVIGSPARNGAAGAIHVVRWSCGDGITGAGETCDDGNVVSGDCCSSICQRDPNGTTCTTGNICEVGACQNGACQGTCMVGVSCTPLCETHTCRLDPGTGACTCVENTTTTTSTSSTTSTTVPPPVAAISPSNALTVLAGEAVLLDGSPSFHPLGIPIDTWQWSVVSAPGEAAYSFSDVGTAFPTFTPSTVGTYSVELTVGVGGSISEPATLTITVDTSSPISLTIVDPPAGAQGLPTSILVRGTVGGPANTGVTVNGLGAAVGSTTWAVADVPLKAGDNVLTATATTPAGDSRTITRLVVSDGQAPTLTLTPEPAAGLVPLSVTFSYVLTPDTGVQAVAMDFDDDGQIDSTSLGPLSTTYGPSGPVTARLQVTDGVGAVHETTALIDVQDFTALDGVLLSIWNDMRTDLVNGQTTSAVQRFEPASQARYEAAFNQLGTGLSGPAGIAASWSTAPVAVWLSSNLAQYALSHSVGGQERAFLITFVKDRTGVWRLGSM